MAQEFDLSRYTEAHERNYATALREICNGRKRSHWMWYVFPQIHGLIPYPSSTNVKYAVRSRAEAEAFLADPYLGGNLLKITEALLALETDDAYEVFGGDDVKLRSCLTLFAKIAGAESVFSRAPDKVFGGKPDFRTMEILKDES